MSVPAAETSKPEDWQGHGEEEQGFGRTAMLSPGPEIET